MTSHRALAWTWFGAELPPAPSPRYRCWLLPVATQPALPAHGVYGVGSALLLFLQRPLPALLAPSGSVPSRPPRRNGVTGPATLFLALNKTLAQRRRPPSPTRPPNTLPTLFFFPSQPPSVSQAAVSAFNCTSSHLPQDLLQTAASSASSASPRLVLRCKPFTFAFAPPKAAPPLLPRDNKQTRITLTAHQPAAP